MMNTFLQAQAMSFGERAAYAGKMLLIGMGAVFASLVILWLALVLFRRLVEGGSTPASKETPETKAVPVVPKAVQPVAVQPPVQNDAAIVAAITAAVAVALAAENGGVTPAFRVVSFRRLDKK